MYANVVVLTYQPPQIKSYTYEIPKVLRGKVQIGQLVEVPFGKRTPLGVIIAVSGQRSAVSNIKPINSILLGNPILLPYQIELLQWMTTYYHAPMVNCLEAILPEIPKKISLYGQSVTLVANQKHGEASLIYSTKSGGTDGVGGGLSEAKNTDRNKTIVSRAFFDGDKTDTSQTLVLVPTINRIPETLALFPKAKNYAIYHNELTKSQKFATWLKILSGKVDFIFGSRSAIFVPCPNLAKIVIFDEHDTSFKDERSPYFDTLTVAEKLHHLTGSLLQIIDSSPKLTTYFVHKDKVVIPRPNKVEIKLVSMAEEKKAGNFSPISLTLEPLLRKTLKTGGRSLLFLNKRVESGQIYCKNCKYQTFVRTKIQVCPNCSSENLWFYSLNISALAGVVRQHLPKTKINLIYESSNQLLTTSYHLPTIDIATAHIFYAPILQKYDLVGHVLIDSSANIVDFVTSERVFSQIVNLRKLAKQNGKLIIQAHNVENPLILDALKNNYKVFFERQVAQRQLLKFPPFALLVKLTIKGKNIAKIAKVAQETALLLKEQSKNSNILVLGPYKPAFWRPYPLYNIMLKRKLDAYSLESREAALKEFEPYLNLVPKDWQITIEPATLN